MERGWTVAGRGPAWAFLKNKRKNPGNREPNLVTEARVGGAEVGSTRVGVAVSAEVSGEASPVEAALASTPQEELDGRPDAL